MAVMRVACGTVAGVPENWAGDDAAGVSPHTQENFDRFYQVLTAQYEELYETCEEYAYAKSRMSAAALARKMTIGLDCGTANKDGLGIQRACKVLGIKHTYKAIREFLGAK